MSGVAGPVVVTGGGQGLGRAFCVAFGAAGASVAVADVNGANATAVANEIIQAGGSALSVSVDVGDPQSVDRMTKEIVAELGPPRVLVNSAAIFSTLRMGPFTDIAPEEWNRVMQVNVGGTFLCCQAVVPLMADQGYGKIVNVSSATVWTGRPGYLHYVTSKAAIIGFTRSLASEVGPLGVRVNCITPGSTATEVKRESITAEAREAMAQATALRRVQVPDDLIGTVLFLSSPASDFITGQTINVDGGYAFH
jgi:3-oxoacyl-[acyl-carrier protein] reductase